MTVPDIAARLDLHTNSVRFHLQRLIRSGEIHEDRADPDGPGRPRMVYTAMRPAPAPDAEPAPESSGYQLLTEMLAGHLAATSDDPGATASAVGEAWGRYLAARPVPFSRTTEEESITRITELLDRAGFSPARDSADGHRLELRVCPFRTVADRRPGVVCAIHLGLMRGALSESDAPLEVSRLDRFTAPHSCIAQLRPSTAADSAGDDDVEALPGWAGRVAG
ncbi:hypothetical protein SRB5_30710 [Streptomyces sp. RB5]|uniref:Transcriptional regulator n=2 Tax=Streptomyces smaragdinus TaxID=2585196 RepID=A0A7K0CIT8_9ACTN|nr:hypothetical protein [Streptomyces smaragdinus]